ncbi:MAG: dethiobiotin synthase [Gammaproteobacteria bacterium]
MSRHVFIAGTDTEVGKTKIACAILTWLNETGYRAVGMKPVAAGSTVGTEGPVNEDALALRACSVPGLRYADTNPWLLDDPTSPDIAARLSGVSVTLEPITRAYAACSAAADVVVVEGIGGWRVPLGSRLQTADMVRHLNLPVILVCGIRLGGISHALLSAEVIIADGLELCGWIANEIDPDYAYASDSIATLEALMPAPLLGINAWQAPDDPDIIDPRLESGLLGLWPQSNGVL